MARSHSALVEELKSGLDAPICLTWELTYGCNLACIHCLSSSGRRDPNELTTAEAMSVIDELRAMQVFYVNIGGGEPTIRSDFYELVDYAVANDVGVKFSTNGSTITTRARRTTGRHGLPGCADLHRRRDRGNQRRSARRRVRTRWRDERWTTWRRRGSVRSRSVSSSRATTWRSSTRCSHSPNGYGAQLRLTRLRPSGRGAETWHRAPSDRGSADRSLPLVAGSSEHAHRRLVLPSRRAR